MNKIILFITLSLTSTLAFSKSMPLGRIVDVKGSSFLYFNGKTTEIKNGDFVYPGSEIFVETTGQVTFTDNADHRFHLASSTSIAISVGNIELRSGQMWIQSVNAVDEYSLTSANSKVQYTAGEAIFSYDSLKSKSQLLVLSGLMKFSNLRLTDYSLHIGEGNFSFVDHSYEGGRPRSPTLVGEKTFTQAIGSYAGVTPLEKKTYEMFANNELLLAKNIEPKTEVIDSKTQIRRYIASAEPEEIIIKVNDSRTVKKKVDVVLKKQQQKTSDPAFSVNIYGLPGYENSPSISMYDLSTSFSQPLKDKRTRMPASTKEANDEFNLESTVDLTKEISTRPTIIEYRESDILLQRLKDL